MGQHPSATQEKPCLQNPPPPSVQHTPTEGMQPSLQTISPGRHWAAITTDEASWKWEDGDSWARRRAGGLREKRFVAAKVVDDRLRRRSVWSEHLMTELDTIVY